MYQLNQCPICNNNSFDPHLLCTDNTVSHETFSLVKCTGCGLIATSPRPADNELGKYYISDQYISHSEKPTSLFDLVYTLIRRLALRWKYTLIKEYAGSIERRLLDYGCGTGDFINYLRLKGFAVTGVEPSPIAAEIAARKTHTRIKENITQVNESFSAITLWHVLEHVPDLSQTVARLKDLLSSNGTMFIAVPNHHSHDAKTYRQHWAAYDVPRHLWHFDVHTFSKLMKNHGLHIHNIIPMKLDAFYVSMLSERHLRGKNGIGSMIRGAIQGLVSNLRANKNEYSSLIYVIKHDH